MRLKCLDENFLKQYSNNNMNNVPDRSISILLHITDMNLTLPAASEHLSTSELAKSLSGRHIFFTTAPPGNALCSSSLCIQTVLYFWQASNVVALSVG